MRILLDTSIWIEAAGDRQFGEAVQAIARAHTILACPPVSAEVENAASFLETKNAGDADSLKRLYGSTLKEDVPGDAAVEALARRYAAKGKAFGIPLKRMKADLAIVAAATIGHADVVLTLNRKTMSSDYSRLAYVIVNRDLGAQTPQFITEKDAIKKLALSP